VPVPAARLADVGAADPQPAVGGGVGKHLGEERAVGVLDGIALEERAAGLGDAARERVTNLLEGAEVEHARRPGGGDPVRHVDAPESRENQRGELALEPPDLPAQLGPCAGLFDLEPSVLGSPPGDQGQPVGPRLPVEQVRHGQSLSGLEGRRRDP
jgi:hypothetical protein